MRKSKISNCKTIEGDSVTYSISRRLPNGDTYFDSVSFSIREMRFRALVARRLRQTRTDYRMAVAAQREARHVAESARAFAHLIF